MSREISLLWYVRAISFIIFILLINNFSGISIALTILFIFTLSFILEKFNNQDNKFAYATRDTFGIFLATFVFLFTTIFFKTLSGFISVLSIMFCLSVLIMQDCISSIIDFVLNKNTSTSFYGETFSGMVRFAPLFISAIVFIIFFDWKTLNMLYNSSWNSISLKELMEILSQFSNYNEKFSFESGIGLFQNSAKEISSRLLLDKYNAINSIRKSLKFSWWIVFAIGIISPFLKLLKK